MSPVHDLPPRVGVLALQGGYQAHQDALGRLGVPSRQVRGPEDLSGLSALILPGGESTVLRRLGNERALWPPLEKLVAAGLPVFGTCAGAILLSREVEDHPDFGLGWIDVTIRRNAFGTQKDSFVTGGDSARERVFIRAPRILRVGEGVEVLDRLEDTQEPVALRQGKVFLSTYHPELCQDLWLLQQFVAVLSEPARIREDGA